MAEFLEVPNFKIFHQGTWAKPEEWWIDGECVYQSDLIDKTGKPVLVTVPNLFMTDLSSIPRIFRLLIPKNGRHRAAAVVHDWLCREEIGPRKQADKIFLEAMAVLNVPQWRRWAMYRAVTITTFFIGRKK